MKLTQIVHNEKYCKHTRKGELGEVRAMKPAGVWSANDGVEGVGVSLQGSIGTGEGHCGREPRDENS